MDSSFTDFLVASAAVIVNPGQDTVLTVRSALLGGRWSGVASAAGVAVGQGVWTVTASAGLAALLVSADVLFLAIRTLGAAYLMGLGIRSVWAARRFEEGAGSQDALDGPRIDERLAFRWGLLSSLGNPMIAIFFTSLLPQFVPRNAPAFVDMTLLGMAFITMNLAWLAAYAVVVDRAGTAIFGPSARRAITTVSGGFLILFGIRLLLLEVP